MDRTIDGMVDLWMDGTTARMMDRMMFSWMDVFVRCSQGNSNSLSLTERKPIFQHIEHPKK